MLRYCMWRLMNRIIAPKAQEDVCTTCEIAPIFGPSCSMILTCVPSRSSCPGSVLAPSLQRPTEVIYYAVKSGRLQNRLDESSEIPLSASLALHVVTLDDHLFRGERQRMAEARIQWAHKKYMPFILNTMRHVVGPVAECA